MHPLLQRIAETPGCSLVDWPFPPELRQIPPGCPDDLAALCREIYEFHLYEIPQSDGTLRTRKGSFQFRPDFQGTVADNHFVDPVEAEDPELRGFTRCFTLGHFGMGNEQLILDLSQPDAPRLRFFHFYPIEPLDDYPVVGLGFEAFVQGCLQAGPERRFVREVADL